MEKRCKWCIVYISMYLYGFVHKELPYISLCFWFLPLECRCRGCLHGVVTWCQSGLTSSDEVRRDCSLSHQNSSGSNLSAIIVMPLSGNSINISLIPKPSCFFFPSLLLSWARTEEAWGWGYLNIPFQLYTDFWYLEEGPKGIWQEIDCFFYTTVFEAHCW